MKIIRCSRRKLPLQKAAFLKLNPGGSDQRNFLPQAYSDFIYAIIIEEYGLLGGAFIVFYIFCLSLSMYPHHH
jgi:cell division protein FtsW